MNELPAFFLDRMKKLLEQEFPAFLESYQQSSAHGLRLNLLKITPEKFRQISPFSLQPIPWVSEGFYYPEQEQPGKHPYHAAGLYYIQEPSAMAAVHVLSPQPGERVLDLCAAPGGKATQVAAALQGQGLLVANEPHPVRVKALAENIERFGIRNAIITNATPQQLAKRLPAYFDRVLVDAPCSGEGMFRKNPEARLQWSPTTVIQCARRQAEILDCASSMLRPGGTLVYSTCTFAPEENEQTVSAFLQRHPDFQLVPIPLANGFSPGRADWAPKGPPLSRTIRLWPHCVRGEGHFIALMQKTGGEVKKVKPIKGSVPNEMLQAFQSFAAEHVQGLWAGEYWACGEQIYLLPEHTPDLSGIRVVRAGLHLGTYRKKRFIPSHSLALALSSHQFSRVVDFPPDADVVYQYLRGHAIPYHSEKGWTLITVHGYPLGFAKQAGGQLKNHYPKGLRILY